MRESETTENTELYGLHTPELADGSFGSCDFLSFSLKIDHSPIAVDVAAQADPLGQVAARLDRAKQVVYVTGTQEAIKALGWGIAGRYVALERGDLIACLANPMSATN